MKGGERIRWFPKGRAPLSSKALTPDLQACLPAGGPRAHSDMGESHVKCKSPRNINILAEGALATWCLESNCLTRKKGKKKKKKKSPEKKLGGAGGPEKGRKLYSPQLPTPTPIHLAKPPPSRDHSFPGQLLFSHPPQAWPQATDIGSYAYPGRISADAILIRL